MLRTITAFLLCSITLSPAVGQPTTEPKVVIPTRTAPVNLDCSKFDSVRGVLCEYSEALLNRNCEPIKNGNQRDKCRAWLEGAGEFEEYYRLAHMCGADWISLVAKECATRAARLD
jgi:hypothetical protein